ncbi:MAG: 4Fe-4S dicluster domain-containing protein [Propionibacteriaceae bacterium]|jgi:ferredoxin like protein|nr:4Fe-4S dicluster domain-containing protein [Propionibacteriaceae bacterium]
MKLPPVAERLGRNRFIINEGNPHIVVNQAVAKATGTAERIIAVCPAHVYSLAEDGTVSVEFAACLECGTCFEVASEGALSWVYPEGGFGVQFRDG